jgi:hypothetical protein
MDIDGEMQIMINIDGLSKMLTTGGVDNPSAGTTVTNG